MSRTTYALLPLLTALALPPGEAIAGPPEGPSGRMVFDEVADGLRKYRAVDDNFQGGEARRTACDTAIGFGDSLT
jgi:hypothetical protein